MMTNTEEKPRKGRASEALGRAARENGKKGGRPKVLTEAHYEAVLEDLESGLSLREVCKRRGSPDVKTILKRVVKEPEGFGDRYARARHVQLLQMEEQLLQLADGKGASESDPKLANAAVQRARLQVDTRKWLMSKMRPDRYGDRVALTGDSNGSPIRLSNADAAREVALLLATAAARRVLAERADQAKAIEVELLEENGDSAISPNVSLDRLESCPLPHPDPFDGATQA